MTEPMVPPVQRLVITGSECTGKTTLAAALAERYDVPAVPEFVRAYAEAQGGLIDVRDHWPIANGQVAAQDAIMSRAVVAQRPLVVFDTDLLSHVTYCHQYTGGCDAGIERLAASRVAEHYLLLDIDVPWIPDGIRDRGDRRQQMHAAFVETLERFGAPYTLIRGSWDERLASATTIVNDLLSPS